MKKILLITLIFILISPLANAGIKFDAPIWEQVGKLVCRGEYSYTCSNGNCEKFQSEIMWEINFERSSIKYLNMDYSEEIRDKFFKYYSELETSVQVIFVEGRMLEFNTDKLKEQVLNEIETILLDIEFPNEYSNYTSVASRFTKLTCYG